MDGPVALRDIEAGYPGGQEELQEKMKNLRQFLQACYHILVQRFGLVEEAGISHKAKRSGLTGRFQDEVHCTATVYLRKDISDLTALNDLTEAIVNVCVKLKVKTLQKILFDQSLPQSDCITSSLQVVRFVRRIGDFRITGQWVSDT